jgi:hypothetical protein
MKQFTAVACNRYYEMSDGGEISPLLELIFLSSEIKYQITNSHSLAKNTDVQEHRFLVNLKGIDTILNAINEYKEIMVGVETGKLKAAEVLK